MIDRELKRSLGQMMHGVQVVGSSHDGVDRCYTSHWVSQVSFSEPIVMASVYPKHDTYPLIEQSGAFTVSLLAGDQVTEGQYFSYPGRKFAYAFGEFVVPWTNFDDRPVVPNAIAWLGCRVRDRVQMADHTLFFADVVAYEPGRLKEPPLLYSSRLGWRIAGDKAREAGTSIRDQLLERITEE